MPDFLVEMPADAPGGWSRRAWRAHVGADLFGRWYAQVTFGQIGAAGRIMRWDFAGEVDAVRFLKRCLRRRAKAGSQPGLRYRTIEASTGVIALLQAAGVAPADKKIISGPNECVRLITHPATVLSDDMDEMVMTQRAKPATKRAKSAPRLMTPDDEEIVAITPEKGRLVLAVRSPAGYGLPDAVPGPHLA